MQIDWVNSEISEGSALACNYLDYLSILLWLIVSVSPGGSFGDEPSHEEETKMQLSHLVIF